MNILFRQSARYFAQRWRQTALSVVGVAAGVAVVVAIDLANDGAISAFEESSRAVSGEATHHIVGGDNGFADSLYAALRTTSDLRVAAAPLLEGIVVAEGVRPAAKAETRRFEKTERLTVIGVDIFAEKDFRPFARLAEREQSFSLSAFIGGGAVAALGETTAKRLGCGVGDTLVVGLGGKTRFVEVIGVAPVSREKNENFGIPDNALFCDIGTAQVILNAPRALSRIDLRIPEERENAESARIQAWLPAGLELIRSASRPQRIAQMSKAFHLNLTALSLLALMVGMFIIYNAMTFSVVRRRAVLGILRVIGTRQDEIFRLVMLESLCIGTLGALVGTALGIVLGSGLTGLVSQTLNDLYFSVTSGDMRVSPLALAKGAALGVAGSLAAAFFPARQAAKSPPITSLRRSLEEEQARKNIPRAAAQGSLALAAGGGVLLLPSTSIIVGYCGLFFIIAGFALWTPFLTKTLMDFMRAGFARFGFITGAMAAQSVTRSLSRTSLAVAALTVAVSATLGVGIMVNSFRGTVETWLSQALNADVYITPPGLVARRNDRAIEPALVEALTRHKSVQDFSTFYTFLGETIEKSEENSLKSKQTVRVFPAQIITSHYTARMAERFKFKEISGNANELWKRFQRGEVFVSESFAFHRQKRVGDSVLLKTDAGRVQFRIAGVYYEYASDIGIVFIERATFQRFWRAETISGLSLFLRAGASAEEYAREAQELCGDIQRLTIQSNKALLANSLEVFDRTFLITDALRLLTIIVAFIGVLSALLALQLEKAKEAGVLRTLGFTPPQVWKLSALQSSLIGVSAGVLAIPLGVFLGYALIFIVNQRSFGWTLQFVVPSSVYASALLLSLLASILAGAYPAWKTSSQTPAAALREE
jgi:putative ABC transport system permease protein